jgi:hypothetical protein
VEVLIKMVGSESVDLAAHCFELLAEPTTTILQLKASLNTEHGVSEGHELLYRGKLLKGMDTLEGVTYISDSYLTCVMLMEGAASKKERIQAALDTAAVSGRF